jgi:ribonuclease HI
LNQPSLFGPTSGGTASANIDGGSRGNPGPAGYGVRIEREDGSVIELKQALALATNNVAEYSGLLAALRWAVANGIAKLHIRSDSELLVKQMKRQGWSARLARSPSSTCAASSTRTPTGWRMRQWTKRRLRRNARFKMQNANTN